MSERGHVIAGRLRQIADRFDHDEHPLTFGGMLVASDLREAADLLDQRPQIDVPEGMSETAFAELVNDAMRRHLEGGGTITVR